MNCMNYFELNFFHWLDNAAKENVPTSLKAFSFNLFNYPYEPGLECKFGVELIGSGEFDEDDEDWACAEIWEPKKRELEIPVSYSTESWEECLNKVGNLVAEILESNSHLAKFLKQGCAVGIGFVDGSLKLLWNEERR